MATSGRSRSDSRLARARFEPRFPADRVAEAIIVAQ